MKGRAIFTSLEKQEIELLLTELRSGIMQDQQKRVRDKLRNLGFYITDFSGTYDGFTCSDFHSLIYNKRIKIIE